MASKAWAKDLAQLLVPRRAWETESSAIHRKVEAWGNALRLFQKVTVRKSQESDSAAPRDSKYTRLWRVDFLSPTINLSMLTCPVDNFLRAFAKAVGIARSPQSSQPDEATGGMQASCTRASMPRETPQSNPAYCRCKAAHAPHIFRSLGMMSAMSLVWIASWQEMLTRQPTACLRRVGTFELFVKSSSNGMVALSAICST